MKDPSIGKIFIIVWFAMSVLITVIGNFVFWFWLRRRGVNLLFRLVGTPGYLEYVYLKWCQSQRRPSTGVLVFRVISLINFIVAAIFFINMVSK